MHRQQKQHKKFGQLTKTNMLRRRHDDIQIILIRSKMLSNAVVVELSYRPVGSSASEFFLTYRGHQDTLRHNGPGTRPPPSSDLVLYSVRQYTCLDSFCSF